MIDVEVQFNDTTANIDFPCTDVYLESKYMELHMPEDAERILFVSEVKSPKSLKVLENMFIKMDELNYLAKRLDSFDKNEIKQFNAVVKQYDMQEMKNLINLTFNLPRYTLIQDIRSMEDVGRTHILNVNGGLGVDEEENYHFAAIGKELMSSGKGQITEYGILFENDELEFLEVYDGRVFPEYYHDECLVSAELRFKGKSEYLYMPCDELAVEKALHRLSAEDIKNCEIHLMNYNVESEDAFRYMQDIMATEDFESVNNFVRAVNEFNEEDWDKLHAVAEYAEVIDGESMTKLAKNINSFIFIPGIDEEEELGRYWIEHNDEYELSQELEDFFLYDQFGEQLQNQLKGSFVETGYVCMAEGQTLDEVLETEENEAMIMGGM